MQKYTERRRKRGDNVRYRTRYTLKQWRAVRGLTLKQVADAVGKSYGIVWNWENGKSEPRASDIAKLEQVLNIKWSDDVVMP